MFIPFIIVALGKTDVCNLKGMSYQRNSGTWENCGKYEGRCFFLSVGQRTELYAVVLPLSVLRGSLSHGMALPQVAGGGTASNMEGSCEYVK
jgi:hypothetical protein